MFSTVHNSVSQRNYVTGKGLHAIIYLTLFNTKKVVKISVRLSRINASFIYQLRMTKRAVVGGRGRGGWRWQAKSDVLVVSFTASRKRE